ncbi:MAG: beta-lactamase family protein, partial [Phycisphaerales bacterium]|nr:beta-lactamase family protein [Phycisphaerales bacterium]
LCHTAGLGYHEGAASIFATPLEFEPGSRWSYSNTGYQLLGRIVERVSGMSYAEYLRTTLFEPAGMMRTCCVGTRPWPYPDCTHSYTDDTDQGSLSTKTTGPFGVGPGGIATCVGDLYLWELALRNNTVLPKDLTALLFTEHARNPGSSVGYGYGWMILKTIRDTKLVLHQGNYGGYNADFRRYVDEGLTIIFLSNHFLEGKSMRDAVMNRVSMLVNGGDIPTAPTVLPVDRAVRDRQTGLYDSPVGPIEVEADPRGLTVRPNGQRSMNMVFAPEPDEPARAFIAQCHDRTQDLFGHVFADDSESCRPLIARALPFEGAWMALRGVADESVAAHESFISCTVIGSALAADGGSARSFALLNMEQGSSLVQLTWVPGGVLHFARAESLPSRTFLPTGPNRYTAFDIFTGRRVDIEFEDSQMSIRANDGTVVGTAIRRM